jgi:hypothetical protein
MNAANPISAAAESGFRQAARLLGASHGAARLTPYVADDRPEGDYSRTVTGYTSYLAWEGGANLLMAALGVRVPETDEGPGSTRAGGSPMTTSTPTTAPPRHSPRTRPLDRE